MLDYNLKLMSALMVESAQGDDYDEMAMAQ